MSLLTLTFAALLYLSGAVLIVGVAWRIVEYARTPAPLKIPTMPAPLTHGGVMLRLAREIVLFESLFRATKWTWAFGWLFHASLALVLVGHLRYFIDPLWWWLPYVQSIALYAGIAMLVGLAGLWARRLLVDRVRYISSPSDHLMLALLIGIGATGVSMRTLAPTDIVAFKQFVLGLLRLDWQPLPPDAILIVHLLLVAALMLVFPFSKLLHAPGVLFSPTRNQRDDSRERRHLAPWAAARESDGGRG